MMHRQTYRLPYVVGLILLVQLGVTYVNTNNNLILAGEDYGLNYVFPELWKYLSTNMWDGMTGTGKPGVTSALTLVWAYIIGALKDAGLSSWFLGRLVFFLFLSLTNISSFLFFRSVLIHSLGEKRDSTILMAALAGSWMYTFSIYVQAMIHHPLYSYHFFIGLLPLLLLLIDWNLRRDLSLAGISLTALVVLLLVNSNPAQIILIMVVVLAYYFFFYFRSEGSDFRRHGYYIAGVVGVSALLTAHIWMPLLGFLLQTGGNNPYGNAGDSLSSFIYNGRRGEMFNIFLGTAYPWFDSFGYIVSYKNNPLVIGAGILLLLFSLSTLLFRRGWRIKIFWLSVALVAMFLSKAAQPPFSGILKSLIETWPALGMYRAAYHKFWVFVALALGMLTTLAMADLCRNYHERHNRWRMEWVLMVFMALIIINRFPFFTGQVIEKEYWIEVPEEYTQLRRFFTSSNLDGKTLALPATPRGAGTIHVWPNGHEFLGPHILTYMGTPYIDAAWFIHRQYFDTEPIDWWEGISLENHMQEMLSASAMFAIRWVYVQKDGPRTYHFRSTSSPSILNIGKKAAMAMSYLNSRGWAKKVLENDYYAIYEISKERSLPHLYVGQRANAVDTAARARTND